MIWLSLQQQFAWCSQTTWQCQWTESTLPCPTHHRTTPWTCENAATGIVNVRISLTSSLSTYLIQPQSWLCTFANFANSSINCFSLDWLPCEGTWGERCMLVDCSTFWCSSEGREAITVWVVGRITDAVFEHAGALLKLVGIQVDPLTTTGSDTARALLGEKSYPVIRTVALHYLQCTLTNSTHGSIHQSVDKCESNLLSSLIPWSRKSKGNYAGPLTSHSLTIEPCKQARPFTAVYDGQKEFHVNKGKMQAYQAWLLGTDDIILLECHIHRYILSNIVTSPGEWHTYQAKFELIAISLLWKTPASEMATTWTSSMLQEDIVI